jgi:hypothetical protein
MNKVAYHICNFYGRETLARLLDGFSKQVPLSQLAVELNVSRQRIHQWKLALGKEETQWVPHPDVLALLGES